MKFMINVFSNVLTWMLAYFFAEHYGVLCLLHNWFSSKA